MFNLIDLTKHKREVLCWAPGPASDYRIAHSLGVIPVTQFIGHSPAAWNLYYALARPLDEPQVLEALPEPALTLIKMAPGHRAQHWTLHAWMARYSGPEFMSVFGPSLFAYLYLPEVRGHVFKQV